jgi:signal transduction histidine kinase
MDAKLRRPVSFFEPGREHPFTWRRLWRTFAISELVAVLIAFMMAVMGAGLASALFGASIYSLAIGNLCSVSTWLTWPWLSRLKAGPQRVLIVLQFFLCGIVGTEIAHGILVLLYDGNVHTGPRLMHWALSMTIAAVIGVVLVTVRQLRDTIEEREHRVAEHELTEARLRQAKSDAELAALQARINPHFLFNTLNSIAALIREDPAKAEAVTLQLSALFRYALQAPKVGLVTLEDELVIVRGYLDIEQVRLGSRLDYELDVPNALSGERLPPLILQPLVENAIRHGISTRVEGGRVTVRARKSDGHVHVSVINTGEGRANPGTGEGLENVRGRLEATFGPEARVTLERRDGDTEARLVFPAAPTL